MIESICSVDLSTVYHTIIKKSIQYHESFLNFNIYKSHLKILYNSRNLWYIEYKNFVTVTNTKEANI